VGACDNYAVWLNGRVRAWMCLVVLFGFFCGRVGAWGPHPQITQAALDALGTNDLLVRHLGEYAQGLTNYSWMADYRRLPFEEPGVLFYADDYLLFPQAPVHWDHICPEVKKTFKPYFERALVALRTETPANAARWIGSLLHFTEDTGSPPHAAEIRGATHSKMENWVDHRLITVPGYRPQLLGTNDTNALQGFLKRMDGLIEFSKQRAAKARLNVEIGHRKAVEPLVLESALETSRMVADLLHTLGEVAFRSGPLFPRRGEGNNQSLLTSAATRGVIKGVVRSEEPIGMERFPAKVILANTNLSTLADQLGYFEFRNLPPGEYRVIALRQGNGRAEKVVHVGQNQTNGCELTLAPEGNLVRNGDFSLRWVDERGPDCWNVFQGYWQGEIIPLKIGQQYRLAAKFKPGGEGEVHVRWTRQLPHAVPRMAAVPMFQTRKLTRDESEHVFTATEGAGLLQLSLKCGPKRPQDIWELIELKPIR
jgi:hypothetical protein